MTGCCKVLGVRIFVLTAAHVGQVTMSYKPPTRQMFCSATGAKFISQPRVLVVAHGILQLEHSGLAASWHVGS